MKPERSILHVDMDAFFASVEQRDNPQLKGLPVIVGGTGPRGVVAAASYEVRRYGVRSAMPMRQALERCPNAICVAPRLSRYREVSAVIFRIFSDFTPLVEGLSLDEAYLDVTGCQGSAHDIAVAIKQRIREATGLTASVGVASNKLVAKIASDLAKPDGLTVVTPANLRQSLDPLPLRRLPGLGGKTGAKVEALGIHTLGELRQAPEARIWPIFGRHSQRIKARAAGDDDRPVAPDRPDLSISAEDTFERDIADPTALRHTLSRLADQACSRMRNRELAAGCVAIKIRQHDFTTLTRQRAIHPPTQERATVIRIATELLNRWLAEHSQARLRLLGVGLRQLTPATQLDLFDTTSDPTRRGRDLDATMDAVRSRFGKDSLRRASSIE